MSGYRALSPNDFLFSSDSVMEVEPPASEEPSDGAESGNAAYSETNNQVAGVQEPDTVKTALHRARLQLKEALKEDFTDV